MGPLGFETGLYEIVRDTRHRPTINERRLFSQKLLAASFVLRGFTKLYIGVVAMKDFRWACPQCVRHAKRCRKGKLHHDLSDEDHKLPERSILDIRRHLGCPLNFHESGDILAEPYLNRWRCASQHRGNGMPFSQPVDGSAS